MCKIMRIYPSITFAKPGWNTDSDLASLVLQWSEICLTTGGVSSILVKKTCRAMSILPILTHLHSFCGCTENNGYFTARGKVGLSTTRETQCATTHSQHAIRQINTITYKRLTVFNFQIYNCSITRLMNLPCFNNATIYNLKFGLLTISFFYLSGHGMPFTC